MAEKRKKTERKVKEKPKGKADEASAKEKIVGAERKVGTRGRVFEGIVIKKFPKRLTIEFGRMIYVRKYERYAKSKTKIHARLPICMDEKIKIGNLVKVQECRPLSKIIHFVVIKEVNEGEGK